MAGAKTRTGSVESTLKLMKSNSTLWLDMNLVYHFDTDWLLVGL